MNLISNKYAHVEFDNNVRAILCDCPDMHSIHVSVVIDRGSREDTPDLKGIAHFAEHAVYLGCDKIQDKHQINKEISRRGIESNAFTSHDCICHWMYCPDEHIEWSVDLLTSMLTKPTFDPKYVEIERNVILNERKMRDDDKDSLLTQISFSNVLKGDSASVPVIGYDETIQSITIDHLRTFITGYSGNNVTLIFVGNIGCIQQFCDKIEPYVMRFPAYCHTFPRHLGPKHLIDDRRVIVKSFNTSVVGVNWKIRGVDVPFDNSVYNDNLNDCVELVVSHLLFSGIQSRMYDELREKRGLCYSIGGYNYTLKDIGIAHIAADVAHENVMTTIDTIKEVMADVYKNGFSSDQVENAKSYFRGDNKLVSDNPTKVAGIIRQSIRDRFDPSLRPGELFKTFDRVTADMVNDFIREYYGLDKMLTCVVTDKEIDI